MGNMDEKQKSSLGKLLINAKIYLQKNYKVYLQNLSVILKQPRMFILCSYYVLALKSS